MLIFLAALAAFEVVVERIASPFQGAEKVERKFAYFAAHKDEYDFVFVGSSRVMNQLSPKVFDAEMAAAGRPCRSFNLGVAAMFLPECSFVINQILALRPSRLRGMVIELSSPAPRHDAEHPLTERDIYWHRPLPTLLASAALWTDADGRATSMQRVAQVWLQSTIFARCMLHLGYGPQLVEQLRKSRSRQDEARKPSSAVIGPLLDGFFPILHTLGHGEAGVAKTGGAMPDLLAFQSAVDRLRATPVAAAPHDASIEPPSIAGRVASDVQRAFIAHQVARLGRHGIEPFYFIGPGTTREQAFLALIADGTVPRLLAFNDPDAYPDLYAPAVRGDRNHLNAAGAELLSRHLARALVAAGAHPSSSPPR